MAGFAPGDIAATPVTGARILVVAARFNAEIVGLLRAGAQAAIERLGASATIIEVPGALEIATAAAIALDAAEQADAPYDGLVALGCVIRGETYHFEIVANESSRALTDLSVARRLPFGNGILTVENNEQAILRADPKQGDKGADAALAALSLIRLKRSLA
ncbi:6,7-dimethyl-8-ribityllumazine synthase [Methylocystis sp. MJC1]|jgi:6,7-dimethyl-8-ribityllumazine synthase|uniref:6,7-dimethyl-8-ribityllumazine synthase n=1 Tax=Methylocystis sp. MJC1 TaxID=2654282 RepID=UPI0013EAB20D|nr:6,7-dimethyl-8-ribityllumazine synthase [Methylocystis sp. MJC1]KAF2992743.1 6,7-dimethyl-8-ribityllumazine synthase 1 [Methylocystis sp. MJC1]MBU6526706.1 6,7-dimethyl-8-ribityllumazine synthase [Methylocystis sp. MJC1]UZX13143.1 6,7-dimethyl-8-ribityllumazine synthase [Methylocystis sp. MJC1]